MGLVLANRRAKSPDENAGTDHQRPGDQRSGVQRTDHAEEYRHRQ